MKIQSKFSTAYCWIRKTLFSCWVMGKLVNGESTEQSMRFKKSQVLFSFRVDAVLVGSLYGGVNWVRRTLNHGQSVSVTFYCTLPSHMQINNHLPNPVSIITTFYKSCHKQINKYCCLFSHISPILLFVFSPAGKGVLCETPTMCRDTGAVLACHEIAETIDKPLMFFLNRSAKQQCAL